MLAYIQYHVTSHLRATSANGMRARNAPYVAYRIELVELSKRVAVVHTVSRGGGRGLREDDESSKEGQISLSSDLYRPAS